MTGDIFHSGIVQMNDLDHLFLISFHSSLPSLLLVSNVPVYSRFNSKINARTSIPESIFLPYNFISVIYFMNQYFCCKNESVLYSARVYIYTH